MNKNKLTSICHNLCEKTGVPFNSIMVYYFLESILKRLAKSSYNENIIFKGGFLLSNVVGVVSRSTVDIDFLVKDIQLSEKKVLALIDESLIIDLKDGVSYDIQSVEPIKEDDQYGGLRVIILCKFDNIRINIPLDIATGDIVTPYPIDYNYSSIFEGNEILIKAYSIETMLAEKLQTIYKRGFLNSRSKDYYDVYLLYRLKEAEIDTMTLIKACQRTFEYRVTEFNLGKLKELLEQLRKDKIFVGRWKVYAKKNYYANDLNFEDIIDEILKLINKMENLMT